MLLILPLSILLVNCGDDDVIPRDNQQVNIIIDNDPDKFNTIVTTPSGDDFKLNSATFSDTGLDISVSYSGGCEPHDFRFVWGNSSSDPEILELAIIHDANGDLCEAFPTETLHLDQAQLDEIDATLLENKTLRIINASNQSSIAVINGLPSFIESKTCQIEVTLEEVVCGDGLFKNKWFKYATTDLGGPIYLQPASVSSLALFDNDLEPGTYSIGVHYTTPFVPDPDTAICLAFPGPSIPVTLFCLEAVD